MSQVQTCVNKHLVVVSPLSYEVQIRRPCYESYSD